MKDILEFSGEHRWLSNFWPAPVILDGKEYASVEHAYQAAKRPPTQRRPFESCTAAEAKKMGRPPYTIATKHWNDRKVEIMRSLIIQKFAPGTELGEKLLATGVAHIEEGNRWEDTFWGTCHGRGENHLGKLIMEQRDALRRQQQ